MDLDYSLPHLLVLLGALQGLIFAVILFSKAKHKADYFLGLFILTLAYNGFETFSAFSGLSGHFYFFDYFSFTVVFLSGPALYFYIRSVLFPQEKRKKSTFIKHMVPFAVLLVLNLSLFTIVTLVKAGLVISNWDIVSVYNTLWLIAEPLSMLAFVFYMALSVRLYIQTSNDHVATAIASKKGITRSWVKVILITMSAFTLIWGVVYVFQGLFSTLGIN